jgi:hypothetical protein
MQQSNPKLRVLFLSLHPATAINTENKKSGNY